MKTTAIITTHGFSDLDKALGLLPKSAARATLRRVLVKAGQPIADRAQSLAPRDTGELSESIKVSTKVKNDIGRAEYAAVMRAGGTKAEAGAAMRAARSASPGQSFAVVLVGPEDAKTKKDAIKRIVQEFGSVTQQPNPYMRPAWDERKREALEIIKSELGAEIVKTARRIGKSKSRSTQDKALAAQAISIVTRG